MNNEYYTPEEVTHLLGISKSTLNRRAEEGVIPSDLEPGKQRGRKYPKKAINAHVKLMNKKDPVNLSFGSTTNAELWSGYQNSVRIYEPEDVVEYETLLEWRKENHDIFMTARENGQRAGGITILPIAESTIKSLIEDKIKEQDIPAWAIRKWDDPELTVYVASISITHTGNKQKDRERGLFIIRNAIKWAYSLERQYDIKKWYAIAATKEGEKLVNHLGFKKIGGKRDAYVMENFKDATRPIKSFLEKLEQQDEIPIPQEKRKRKGSSI